MQAIYTDTVFNKDVKLHGESELEDNFDLVHLTAEKLYIIRPILKPAVLEQILKGMWTHIDAVFYQCLATFYPEPNQLENNLPANTQPVDVNSDDECLPRLKDLREQNKGPKIEMGEVDEDNYQPPNDTIPQDEAEVFADADQPVEREKTKLICRLLTTSKNDFEEWNLILTRRQRK